MTTLLPSRSRHTPTRPLDATATRKRALRAPEPIIEKWDVVSWNNQVYSSKDSGGCHLSGSESVLDSVPCVQETSNLFTSAQPHSAPASNPRFATTASAFGFGTAPTRPRAIRRRKSTHEPVPDSHQTRLAALSALHRSVEEHDADFLARMRELEERCHLLPDSLSVLRSSDLAASGASRGRKRDVASSDDDGDVEMSSWNERRRKHRSLRSDSPTLGSTASACDEKTSHSSDDEYVVTNQDSIESDSSSDEDEEDDDLDIVIVPSPSSATSTPPSLSTSLSSLPARSGSPHLHQYTTSPLIPGPIKGADELAAAMAGGAGSVVEWTVSSDDIGDESHFINPDNAQAGALWA